MFLSITQVYAADTLTRAEVYNYNIGDTFDYRIFNYSGDIYQRIIIKNIYWSVDTQTKYIVRSRIFPSPLYTDTLTLTDLNKCEVCLDTPSNFRPTDGLGQDTIILNTLPFWGRETNFIKFFGTSYIHPFMLFAKGLGCTVCGDWGGVHSFSWVDTTVLIYYSGDSGTLGTPYTLFYTGVTDQSNQPDPISIYPNPTTHYVIISMASSIPDKSYTITDMSGRILMSGSIGNSPHLVVLDDQISKGVYLVHAVGRCYKLVKE